MIRGLARSRDKQNHYISTATMPMETKLGSMMACHVRLLPIDLPDPLITWSCKIKWQAKPIISLLKQGILTYLVGWWHKLNMSLNGIFKNLFNFTILMATTIGRVLTSGRSFSTQTLELIPTSYWACMCLSVHHRLNKHGNLFSK